MFRIDSPGSIASRPTPAALGTEGYFTEGNPATSQPATQVSADILNMVQESLIAFLTAGGLAHSKTDYSRLWQAIGRSVTFQDVGSANAVVVSLPAGLAFPLGSVGLGTLIRVKLAASFTGAATFAPFGLAATPILRSDGTAVGPGDGIAGSIAELVNDGAGHWQILAGGKATLTTVASLTIYVRTDGNDANDGSENNAPGAVATLARAYRLASRYYVPGGAVTIQISLAGSYASAAVPAMASALIIRGDAAAQNSYIIHGAGANNMSASAGSSNISLIGLLVVNDDSTNNLLTAANGGSIALNQVSLGAAGSGNTAAMIVAFPGGSVTLGTGVTINSNCGIGIAANGGAITLQAGGSMAAAGGPAFSDVAVSASDGGVAQLTGTISGAATGVRYRATTNSVIDTSGKGASGIFGSSPGSVSTGGQYV